MFSTYTFCQEQNPCGTGFASFKSNLSSEKKLFLERNQYDEKCNYKVTFIHLNDD